MAILLRICRRASPTARCVSVFARSALNRRLCSSTSQASSSQHARRSRSPWAAWATALAPVVALGAGLSLWPLFDLFVLPWAARRSLYAKKFTTGVDANEHDKAAADADAIAPAVTAMESAIKECRQTGRVVLICGNDAQKLGREFVRSRESPCAYVDWGQQFSMNPYEITSLRFLGQVGDMLNSYVKAALFVGSVLTQRHPHVDAILYIHDATNSLCSALVDVKRSGPRPVLVVDRVDLLLRIRQEANFEVTQALGTYMCLTVAEQSLQLVNDDVADVVWLCRGNSRSVQKILDHTLFQGLRGRTRVFETQSSWTGQLQLVPR